MLMGTISSISLPSPPPPPIFLPIRIKRKYVLFCETINYVALIQDIEEILMLEKNALINWMKNKLDFNRSLNEDKIDEK